MYKRVIRPNKSPEKYQQDQHAKIIIMFLYPSSSKLNNVMGKKDLIHNSKKNLQQSPPCSQFHFLRFQLPKVNCDLEILSGKFQK